MFTDTLSDRQKAISLLTVQLALQTNARLANLNPRELREALRDEYLTAQLLLDVAAQVVVGEMAK